MEKFLHETNTATVRNSCIVLVLMPAYYVASKVSSSALKGLKLPSENITSPQMSYSAASDNVHRRSTRSPENSPNHNMQNAILAPFHTSATESILKWPNFDAYPSLRFQEDTSIFHLEHLRLPIPEKPAIMYPYVSNDVVGCIIDAFQRNINFWYPTMSEDKRIDLEAKIVAGNLDQSCHSCLALLLMALGCACDSIATVFIGDEVDLEDSDYQRQRRAMGEMYFDGAMKRLHFAHVEICVEAAQCLLFVA
jgi:hypothetical protein